METYFNEKVAYMYVFVFVLKRDNLEKPNRLFINFQQINGLLGKNLFKSE